MSAAIQRLSASAGTDRLMPAVTAAAAISILALDNLVDMFLLNDSMVGTLQGVNSDLPWMWRGIKGSLSLEEAVPGYAPGLVLGGDNQYYLRFGYGGSGSSGFTLSGTDGQNGSLIGSQGQQAFYYETGYTLVALARIPVPGGVAGPTPGGSIIGNKLNQISTYGDAGNIRWSGLGVGYATTINVGEPRFCLNGDDHFQAINGTNYEARDGKWHIPAGRFDFHAGTHNQAINMRLDGVDKGSSNPSTTALYDLNTTVGGTELRVGACGLPYAAAPTVGLKGDIRALAVLKGAVLSECQQIEAYFATLASIN